MNEETALYDVFIRNWYRYGPRSQFTGKRAIILGPGRKTYRARGITWSQAREMCERYNSTHNPGKLSRKMEFERQ